MMRRLAVVKERLARGSSGAHASETAAEIIMTMIQP
jgi:hypothetical protein